MTLYERANHHGASRIKEWLPDGRMEGDEWVCLNPRRADKNLGSFKVNLSSGAWADFADSDAQGGDAVSLYAYLHGMGQGEAARAILEAYDMSYFPSSKDKFDAPKAAPGDYWSGWKLMPHGSSEPPPLETDWYQKKFGNEQRRWYFKSEKRKVVMAVVRFFSDGKKNDRPFTLWTKDGDIKWRSKGLDAYPLWNLEGLLDRPGDEVILSEGQKAAEDAGAYYIDFVSVGWYGGASETAVNKTDWEPLRGRTVYYLPDADTTGRRVLKRIRELAEQLDIKLKVLHPPGAKPKGWDLGDAAAEKVPLSELQSKTGFLDDKADSGLPFRIVGVKGNDIVFYSFLSRTIIEYKKSALTKNALFALADREIWASYFSKPDGGIHWDAAVCKLIDWSHEAPIFNHHLIRGPGAWRDEGKLVVSTGESIIIDGKTMPLHEAPGRYVYERSVTADYRADGALATDQAARLLDMLGLIEMKHPAAQLLLAGWILLAPWGGALKWRPHIWLTAAKGTGKSTIVNQILGRIFLYESMSVMVKGQSSTIAGVRQGLRNRNVPIIIDETEADEKKQDESLGQIIKAIREGSSGDGRGPATMHGTSDGEGRSWAFSSMALFASITAVLKHGADRDRFTVIELTPPNQQDNDDRERRWLKLESMIHELLTNEYARAFHARSYNLFDEITKAIEIMTARITEHLGARRYGDQIGTLLAGAWMISHDKAPIASEAEAWVKEMDLGALVVSSETPDEELVLQEIMAAMIRMDGQDYTIGKLCQFWFYTKKTVGVECEALNLKDDQVKTALEQCGIKPVVYAGTMKIQIAQGHPWIRKALRDTPWGNTYAEMLTRMPIVTPSGGGTIKFAGVNKRAVTVDASDLFEDQVPF